MGFKSSTNLRMPRRMTAITNMPRMNVPNAIPIVAPVPKADPHCSEYGPCLGTALVTVAPFDGVAAQT